MENISLVTFSELFLMDEILAKERKYLSDMVNLHEMAHSTFFLSSSYFLLGLTHCM